MQCVANCGPLDDPTTRKTFEQPVWQTATMFVGETFCLIAFSLINSRFNLFARPVKAGVSLPTDDVVVEGKKETKKMRFGDAMLFWLPAVCDILGTTFMSIGLLFIPVSVYQMLRGALVLYVPLPLFLLDAIQTDALPHLQLGRPLQRPLPPPPPHSRAMGRPGRDHARRRDRGRSLAHSGQESGNTA